ncbi:hypothetical protein [Nocardia pneumoniae]|uniref:hypothetical protein n=1 Tax=Nocardia pneumoniae TaxID=228601 RepID=UPI0002ECD099|nr:hypothetical protein [Nocardia pneumoniae]
MEELPEIHVGTAERAQMAPLKADHVAAGRLRAAECDRLVVRADRRDEAGEG